ncbi:MAG: glycoside hydrolase family 35 protein [Acidobacteriaceae bacterium]
MSCSTRRGLRGLTLLLAAAALLLPAQLFAASSAKYADTPATGHSFGVQGNHFVLDGKPFVMRSGEMHYARIPRADWRARMRMAKAMGLNTIATYIFWNVHEPKPGVYDFSGNYDVAAFIRMAQEEGLYVLLRTGPYSCAEWEFGGFPAWLMANPKMTTALRSNDPAFMVPVEKWIDRLGKELAPLQLANGGPILGVQVENEYGDFGSDRAYMEHLKEIFLKAGFNKSMLYTADPRKALPRGTIPGIIAGVNFGPGGAENAYQVQQAFRPAQPPFATEYWPGWFDHWGEPHQTKDVAVQLKDLQWMLEHNVSFNIYMFHGGTSFGFMSGSSWTKNSFHPDVTSYDYDAPLDEAGHPTPKYYAYRNLIARYTDHPLPPVPATTPVIAIPAFTLQESASLWKSLPKPVASAEPQPMEMLGQSYGYILYRTQINSPVQGALVLNELHDYAQIYLDGKQVGTLDRRFKQNQLDLSVTKPAQLDILVANDGRINSTRMMRQERKGITESVTLAGKQLTGWQIYTLPMQDFAQIHFHRKSISGPAFYRGGFQLSATGDAFLDVSTLGKGAVWINGHALGRFWKIGPQQTLYVPAPWLKKGWNQVTVFDMQGQPDRQLKGLLQPIIAAPVADAENPLVRLKE